LIWRTIQSGAGLIATGALLWGIQASVHHYHSRQASRALVAEMNADVATTLAAYWKERSTCTPPPPGRTFRPSLVLRLLKEGAAPDVVDQRGRRLLHLAALTGNRELLRALLDRGARVDRKDGLGRTPLMWAVAAGNQEVAEVLLESGANVNHRTVSGETALRLCVNAAEIRIVKMLLQHGADIRVAEAGGDSLRQIAGQREKRGLPSQDLLQALRTNSPGPSQPNDDYHP
jgi:ankyrin repeat protein